MPTAAVPAVADAPPVAFALACCAAAIVRLPPSASEPVPMRASVATVERVIPTEGESATPLAAAPIFASAVAVLLGQNLPKSKSVSTSNWARATLEPRQLLYAANDAYAALRVYQALQLRTEQGNQGPAPGF